MSGFLLAIARQHTLPALDRAVRCLAQIGVPRPFLHEQPDTQQPVALYLTRDASACWTCTNPLLVLAGHPERVHPSSDAPAFTSPATAEAIAASWSSAGMALIDALSGRCASAVWDAHSQRLTLQVDQFGIASLYLRVTSDAILVCTEVAPLLAISPNVEFDQGALRDIVATRFLAGACTAWQDVRQVTAGRRLTVHADGTINEEASARFSFEASDPGMSLDSATRATGAALRANLERLRDSGVSDVAVPLSGGIDSSIVAALAAHVFPRCTAVTFKIDNFANPELERASTVAQRLGIRLHVVRVGDGDVARLYPWIVSRLQEPPRHYNNPALVRMLEEIRGIAPVVLAGDLAAVYGSALIRAIDRQLGLQRTVSALPVWARRAGGEMLRRTSIARLSRAADLMQLSMVEIIQRSRTVSLTPAAAEALPPHARTARCSDDFVNRTYDFSLGVREAGLLWTFRVIEHPLLRRNARFADALGLRYHYPLEDAAALHLAARFPAELRWHARYPHGKPVLRQLCAELVGEDVVAWPKIGFPTPELDWMQGPLADQLDAAFAADSPLASFVDVSAMRRLPRAENRQALWTMMTLSETLRQGASLMHV